MWNFSVFILCFLLLGTGCAERDPQNEVKQEILKDVPLNKKGKESYAYTSLREAASKFDLDSLDLGFDSLQIRIWFGFAKCDSSQIFILKNSHGRWSAQSIIIRYLWDDSSLSVMLSDTISKIMYNQQFDWVRIIRQLTDLQIQTLLDMDKISGYKYIDGVDGSGCSVEVATKNTYRLYGYWEPSQFADRYWQARNIIKIIKVLESEFKFKTLREI